MILNDGFLPFFFWLLVKPPQRHVVSSRVNQGPSGGDRQDGQYTGWTHPVSGVDGSDGRFCSNYTLDVSFYHHRITNRYQAPKMEVLTYISCMDTAYVKEKPTPKLPYNF